MIATLVLAAGASTRLGRPKQLLDFGGTPCLTRVVRACSASATDPTLVVLGCKGEAIQRLCDLTDTQIVLNPDWETGQTGSIQAGLRALNDPVEAFLLLPVDHALVTADLINALIAQFHAAPDPKAIILPTYHGCHGHPALFGAFYRDAILQLPEGVGANRVVHDNRDRVIELPSDDRWVLFDIDTEADYQTALTEFTRRQTAS